MPKNAEVFAVNDRITHAVHGLGTIRVVDSRYTTIEFDEAGTRKFLTDLVQLARTDAPPAAKPARATKAKAKAKPKK